MSTYGSVARHVALVVEGKAKVGLPLDPVSSSTARMSQLRSHGQRVEATVRSQLCHYHLQQTWEYQTDHSNQPVAWMTRSKRRACRSE